MDAIIYLLGMFSGSYFVKKFEPFTLEVLLYKLS